MKLKTLSLALAFGVMGALAMLAITYYPWLSEAVIGAPKGESILALMQDIYPYYDSGMWYAPIAGAVCGFLDGFVGGLVFGWLYNAFTKK